MHRMIFFCALFYLQQNIERRERELEVMHSTNTREVVLHIYEFMPEMSARKRTIDILIMVPHGITVKTLVQH